MTSAPHDTLPAYAKWIAGIALLVAATIICVFSLQHIFTQGACCADDSVFSWVAKTFATKLEYGFPEAEGAFKPFGVGVTLGPTMILPAALGIALFGAQPWLPALSAFATFVVQLAVFGWLLSKTYDKWRVTIFIAAALFAVIATTRFFNYYAIFLGEGPALGYLLIGIACLQLQQSRTLYLYLAGLMFGLAVLTKTIEAFAIVGVLAVWFFYRFAIVRWGAILEALRVGLSLLAPLIAFELVKLASLGPDGYADHWRDFRALSAQLHQRPDDVLGAFLHALQNLYLLSWASAAFAVLMLALAAFQFVRSGYRTHALLPFLLLGGIVTHVLYVILFSNLWPRYLWVGVLLLDFAVAAPLLLLNGRAAVAAFALVVATFAPPQAIAGYMQYQNSLLERNTIAERRVMLDFIARRPHLPLITQWWGSGADVFYLLDRPRPWRFANVAAEVDDLRGLVVLNSHFMARNDFHAALAAKCVRREPQLRLYELYVCGGAFIPDATGLDERLVIASAELSGAARPGAWAPDIGAPPVDAERSWGTFGGHGAGRISLTISIPDGVREIAVPVAAGAEAGIALRAYDRFDVEIAALPALAPSDGWRIWRIEAPASLPERLLRIELDDSGAAPEQWGAIGAPWTIRSLTPGADLRPLSLERLMRTAAASDVPAELIEEGTPNGDPAPAIFAHAPMDLSAVVPRGTRELVVNFGMRSPSYRANPGTKGVCFTVAAGPENSPPQEIWRRCLTPVETPADRGMQEAIVPLEGDTRRIVFRTRPAVGGDATWAWSYWADPRTR